VLQCAVLCCSVLQCAAVCYCVFNVLQSVAGCFVVVANGSTLFSGAHMYTCTLQCAVVCCSML